MENGRGDGSRRVLCGCRRGGRSAGIGEGDPAPGGEGGKRLADPNKPGALQFSVYDQDFKWRLPLASLLPRKFDPKSNEDFPGNFDYNPFTGDKLKTR
jgi:hypothetical protein